MKPSPTIHINKVRWNIAASILNSINPKGLPVPKIGDNSRVKEPLPNNQK